MWIIKEMGGTGLRGGERCWMGVDKEELSSRFTKIFKGHFLKWGVKGLATFKAELLSHCSSTAVYDIPFSSSVSLLLSNVKNIISNVATQDRIEAVGHNYQNTLVLTWLFFPLSLLPQWLYPHTTTGVRVLSYMFFLMGRQGSLVVSALN